MGDAIPPSNASPLPPNEIRQHMISALNHRKDNNPSGIFAKLPALPTSYTNGFRSASNLQVWNAVNHMAWWLHNSLKKKSDDDEDDDDNNNDDNFETLAYLGPGDLRYSIILLAAIKTGYKVFYPSLRNSKVAFEVLLGQLQCKIVLTTSPEPAPVALVSQCDISQKLHVPSLQDLFNVQDVTEYPYTKTYEEAKNDPVCVLHTSGSTGIPKPLVFTNQFIAAVVSNTLLEPPEGFDSPNRLLTQGSTLITLPAFHMAGLAFSLFVPIFNGSYPVYPLPGPPPSLQSIIEAVSNTKVDWALVAPMVLQELSQNKESLATLASKIEHLFYIGGKPPREAGDVVASSMLLHQIFGSSEFGSFPLIYRNRLSQKTDWRSVEFHPQINAELRHRFDDLHELVLVNKHVHGRPEPVFAIFPELEEYETGDLFTPHPQESPNSWVHESRLDDVIVFLTGEKANPVSFEHMVTGHPEVRSVLMSGEGQFEAALLIELVDTAKDVSGDEKQKIIERIWPVVRKANSYYPGYAHISQTRILFTTPEKPMARTGKGTVQRKGTLALYKEELEDLDNKADTGMSFTLPEDFDITNRDIVSRVVRMFVRQVTGWDEMADEDEFFSLGMDSLVVHRLSRGFKQHPEFSSIEPKTIYMNPSIGSLVDLFVGSGSKSQQQATNGTTRVRTEQITEILEAQKAALLSLCKDVKIEHPPHDTSQQESQAVLLTGSTGTVGSFLLDGLLRDSKVTHIYCLNRSPDSQKVQIRRNTARGLSVEFPPTRVTFLTGNLTKPDLGLSSTDVELVKSQVTQIIHNAWPVDFNRSLISFKPSLDGIVNLLSLAAHSSHIPSLLFLSSISATANFLKTVNAASVVPEEVLYDMESPANTGYGESKYIAELILDYASREIGLQTGIVRIGQVAGAVETLRGWNRNEWFPSMIISSKHIKALPESIGFKDEQVPDGMMGDIDWIPIDRLNSIILDFASHLVRNETSSRPLVFHAVNPSTIAWTQLLPTIKENLSHTEAEDIRILPYSDWVDHLQSISSTESQDLKIGAEMAYKNPGFKLLDFYRDVSHREGMMARLDTAQTAKMSPLLQSLEPLRAEWMGGWIQDWLSHEKA